MSDATLKVELTAEQKAAAQAKAMETIAQWFDASERLKALKDAESDLRAQVVSYWFPDGLKEGTNKCDMPEGWKLDVKGSINRKIDVAAQSAVQEMLKEQFQIDAGELVKYKPELDLPAYRQLQKSAADATGERKVVAEKILKTFEQMLIITPGSPQVSLVAPKKPKAKVEA